MLRSAQIGQFQRGDNPGFLRTNISHFKGLSDPVEPYPSHA